MSNRPPVIALVSGVHASIAPATEAVLEEIPDAVIWNMLDDQLIPDTIAAGGATPALERRTRRLLAHAAEGGADAILLTCSLYAHLADSASAELGVPVVASDDAAFRELADAGFSRVAIVSAVPLALSDSTARARQLAGAEVEVMPVIAAEARTPSLAGDVARTASAVASAVREHAPLAEAVVLANYSLVLAATALSADLGRPVLSGARSAARELRGLTATVLRSKAAVST